MKRLPNIENETVQLEVGECDCGYHFTADATYLEQVRDFTFDCPSCGKRIDTYAVFGDASPMTLREALRDAISRLKEFIGSDCECDNTHKQNGTKCCLCEYDQVLEENQEG